MATVEVEADFTGCFWGAAIAGSDSATRIVGHMRGEMLEWKELGEVFDYLANRYAKSAPLDDLEVEEHLIGLVGDVWYDALLDRAKQGGKLKEYTRRVLFSWRARRQAKYLREAAQLAGSYVGKDDEHAGEIATDVITRLAKIHTPQGDNGRPSSRKEITDWALARLHITEQAGIRWPYPKLQEQMGNLLPGDVVGIAGYSNSGKSLFAANLWRLFAVAGIPTISFPTEMGLAWHARAVAAHTKVPQLLAEREQWTTAPRDQLEAYEFGLRDLGNCPWEIVDKPAISLREIIARTSVLRRQWPGRPVVLIVDHMHRLDYGGEDADKAAGPATRELRNWIREDDLGGIIALLLYQPRKPLDEIEFYRPVSLYQIRGKSEIGNEIDYLLSPYRRWIMTDSRTKTPWGTPGTKYDENGWPEYTVPNAKGAKLDDERIYVKVGKRRVGGEGPTIVEHIEAPSGHVFELTKPKLAVVGGGT